MPSNKDKLNKIKSAKAKLKKYQKENQNKKLKSHDDPNEINVDNRLIENRLTENFENSIQETGQSTSLQDEPDVSQIKVNSEAPANSNTSIEHAIPNGQIHNTDPTSNFHVDPGHSSTVPASNENQNLDPSQDQISNPDPILHHPNPPQNTNETSENQTHRSSFVSINSQDMQELETATQNMIKTEQYNELLEKYQIESTQLKTAQVYLQQFQGRIRLQQQSIQDLLDEKSELNNKVETLNSQINTFKNSENSSSVNIKNLSVKFENLQREFVLIKDSKEKYQLNSEQLEAELDALREISG